MLGKIEEFGSTLSVAFLTSYRLLLYGLCGLFRLQSLFSENVARG